MTLPRHYPWIVALLAAFILAVNNGFTFAGITVFDGSILDDLDINVGSLKLRDTFTYLAAAICAPFAGALADRIGAKPLIIIGSILIAAVFYLYSSIQSTTHIYGLHVMMGVGLATGGLMMCVVLVSRWFDKRRGLALGILVAGSSLGNALLPQFNTYLVGQHGWRDAIALTALAPLAVAVIVLFFIREPKRASADQPAVVSNTGFTFAETMRSPSFWFTGAIAFTTFFGLMGLTANLMIHMQRDLGFELSRADDTLLILFITAFLSKLAAGWGSDRVGVKPVLLVGIGLMAVGVGAMTIMSKTWVWPGVFALGLGWGALYTLIQLLPSYLFGLKSLGKIMGSITVLETLGGASGPFVIGMLYDRTGDYRASFIVVTVVLGVAWVCAALLRSKPYSIPAASEPTPAH